MGLEQEDFFTVSARLSGQAKGAQAVVVAVCPIRGGKPVPEEAVERHVRFDGRLSPKTRADFNIDDDLLRRIEEGDSQADVWADLAALIGRAPVVVFGRDMVGESLGFLDPKMALDGTRLARRVWERGTVGPSRQALESHRVYELRYWLDLVPDVMSNEPTGAFAESINAASVFVTALGVALKNGCEDSVEGLFAFVEKPVEYTRVPYGRLGGKLFSDLSGNDLERLVVGDDVDPDIRLAVEGELGSRNAQLEKMSVFRRPAPA